MARVYRPAALLTLVGSLFVLPAAQAQYPSGYGGYGWHGWGGGSSSGRTAAGLGVFAAGAGQGAANLGAGQAMNAQARAQNAQTIQGINEYNYACNQRNIQHYYARMAERQADNVNALSQIQDRILNHPLEGDIFNGDSLNALLIQVMNPKIYGRTLDMAQKPLRSAMVKRLPFEYAAGGITYSLMDLTTPDSVPVLYNDPAFAEQRKAIARIAAELRKESTIQRSPSAATIRQFRAALDGMKAILEAIPNPDQTQKLSAERYLKALYGLTKMIDSPAYDVYLAAVDAEPTVPLCEVLSFMHAFNLQFGPATTPDTREYYSQLYSALSDLRQQVNPPAGSFAPAPPAAGGSPDNRAANYFGGMPYQSVMAPNVPPPPPQPR